MRSLTGAAFRAGINRKAMSLTKRLPPKILPASARFRKIPEGANVILSAVVMAVAAGLSAVGFLFMTNLIFSKTYVALASGTRLTFLLGSLAVIVVSSLLVGILLNLFAPEAAGSGIPQMKAAYWKEVGYVPFKPVAVKFVAGIISIGGGTSLGREGPSVYVGSGVASNLAGLFGAGRRERRGPAAAGGSAGLAAAFNSPLAAIAFSIEEITNELNNKYLGFVVLASVVGAFVVHALIGRQPAYFLAPVENISWIHYALVPLVAFAASLAGVAFQRGTLFLRGRMKSQRTVPPWLRPLLGGLVTWALGAAVFLGTGKLGVFGLGYHDLSDALRHNFPWITAGLILAAKLLATIASYGFGGCGGIFAPMLFIGGMTGYFLAGLAGQWMPLTPADTIVLSVVGMSSCLGALVRAPLTALLIVFEMTHQFSLVPGLLLGAVISQGVARLAGRLNFYDALLVQDGHELHRIRPPKDMESWQNLPVGAIANPKPVCWTDDSSESLKELISKYSYNVFPVVVGGKLRGTVSRQAVEEALEVEPWKPPPVKKAVTCYPDQAVREVGDKFIKSPVNVLVVIDRKDGSVKGIITLHDLIRAQAAVSE